jgi:flagellin
MSISLLSNVAALNVKRHLNETNELFSQAAERLASGRRINKAGDDAAGLSISFGLEAKIRSIQVARRNSQDALSMMEVAEGGMNEVGNILVRMRELAIQASSDNVSDRERSMLDLEVGQLKEEVDRLSQATRYFDTPLLNGSGKDFTFQIGIDNNENNRLTYAASSLDLRASTLGVSGISLTDIDGARDAFGQIDEALIRMNAPRSQIGALQTRMHSVANNLSSYEESLTGANARIRDADIAKETADAVRGQVLQKAGISVLAQANMLPTQALKLIEG